MSNWRNLLTTNLSTANIIIIGNPYDKAVSCNKGASLAPQKIRFLSSYLPPVSYHGEVIKVKVYDIGDIVDYTANNSDKYQETLKTEKFIIQLGGDHSVSITSARAFLKHHQNKKIGLIHFDAHADLCNVYDNNIYSHACVNRRIIEAGLTNTDIAYVGLRSWELEEVEYINKNAKNYYPMSVINEKGIDYVIKKLQEKFANYEAVYLSFDIDIVDPAYAPGTGTPEAGGLSSIEALKMIRSLVENLNVLALDIVEVAPPLDVNDITSWLALKLIYEVFAAVDKKLSVK